MSTFWRNSNEPEKSRKPTVVDDPAAERRYTSIYSLLTFGPAFPFMFPKVAITVVRASARSNPIPVSIVSGCGREHIVSRLRQEYLSNHSTNRKPWKYHPVHKCYISETCQGTNIDELGPKHELNPGTFPPLDMGCMLVVGLRLYSQPGGGSDGYTQEAAALGQHWHWHCCTRRYGETDEQSPRSGVR